METLGIFLLVFFGLAIFCRVPIAYSLGLGAIAGFLYNGYGLTSLAQAAYNGLNSLPYLAILFFIFAGVLMEHTGISRSLLECVNAFIGRLRGSIGHVCIVVSAAFGVLTGSVLATVSAIGKMVLPEMDKKGYSRSYSAALMTCSSILGVMIPPSVPGIIYALSSGLKVSDVWLATVGPAFLLIAVYCTVHMFYRGRKEEKAPPIKFDKYAKNCVVSTGRAVPALIMPIIIFGSIYGGICTPTEAGAVAVAYGVIYYLIKKFLAKLKVTSSLWQMLIDSTVTTAAIGALIVFANTTSRIITQSGVANSLSTFVVDNISSAAGFLLLTNILFLIMGTFLDINASIMILIPLLSPTVAALGIDPVHFSAVALLNLCIGFMTPPFAASLFLACKICDSDFIESVKAELPFMIGALLVLVLVTIFPQIALFGPNLFA